MNAMLGWLMLASWIAMVWMAYKIVHDVRVAVRTRRTHR
jgi:hypothetical protein